MTSAYAFRQLFSFLSSLTFGFAAALLERISLSHPLNQNETPRR
jgi:hypothetical protein